MLRPSYFETGQYRIVFRRLCSAQQNLVISVQPRTDIFCILPYQSPNRHSREVSEECFLKGFLAVMQDIGLFYPAMEGVLPPLDKTAVILLHKLSECALFFSSAGVLPDCVRERRFSLGWNDIRVPGMFVPECTVEGKYENIQCHARSGECWCVDEMGREYPDTRVEGKPDCQEIKRTSLPFFACSDHA